VVVGAIATIHAQTVHALITKPDQGLTPIYQMLTSASRTIDMTMYELVDTQAEWLLVEATGRGVAVRVILDQNLEQGDNQEAYDYLQSHGVKVVWANKKYAATHQKTIVTDGSMAAIMTLNLTSRYYSNTRDFAVIDTDAHDVAAIEEVFDADFTGAAVTPTAGDGLVWSPAQSSPALLAMIASAKSSLQIESEEMSDSAVVIALMTAARSGVQDAANFTKLKTAGVKVSTYAANASLYIHAKIILADFGEKSATAFVGSENFSVASLQRNRELGIVLSDAAILASLNETLTQDFNGATAWK
jgi:phosphatidylserine/phosphatidylglycerophosphate/cardiolipin synthase-like enzyme